MTDSKPIGELYSHVYVERGTRVEDSERFRRRIAAFLDQASQGARELAARKVSIELGAEVHSFDISTFVQNIGLVDLLDLITIVYQSWGGERYQVAKNWRVFVERVLKEENIAYSVDEACGVHPAFDEQFESSRRATIAALSDSRYAAALQSFENSIDDLKVPRDTRDAVRKVFDAVENVAKLMIPQVARLGAAEVEKRIKPLAEAQRKGTERNATNLMLKGLAEWVNACHQYRHAPGVEEPEPPSLELAIWMVSTGASHLRWLVSLDQSRLAKA